MLEFEIGQVLGNRQFGEPARGEAAAIWGSKIDNFPRNFGKFRQSKLCLIVRGVFSAIWGAEVTSRPGRPSSDRI